MEQLNKANHFIEENSCKINQTYRNHYHLMGPIGWINDPNGFIYFRGEYHLFYQYHPYDSIWGPMHWGHAKSKDLINWENLPIALAPSEYYDIDGCFSGTAIVKDDKLYLYYTGHVENEEERKEVQCVAISEDGIFFEKYVNNPIIDERHIQDKAPIEDFRDPKVFQYENHYYMLVASKTNNNLGQILMFKSKDLYDWSYCSVFLEGETEQGVMWECPDLFQLDDKYILIMSPIEMKSKGYFYQNRSSAVAFVGVVDWDKGEFKVENMHEIDGGLDFYAPQTAQGPNNQRVLVAWMQMWDRNMPTNDLKHRWAGSMTLPREVYLENNQLKQRPISIDPSYLKLKGEVNKILKDETFILKDIVTLTNYIKIKFEVSKTKNWSLKYGKNDENYFEISYDTEKNILTTSREKIGYFIKGVEEPVLNSRSIYLEPKDNIIELALFRDTSSFEIFTHDGRTMTTTFYEENFGKNIELSAIGELNINELHVFEINLEGAEN